MMIILSYLHYLMCYEKKTILMQCCPFHVPIPSIIKYLNLNLLLTENHQGSRREGGQDHSTLHCRDAVLWIQLELRELYKKINLWLTMFCFISNLSNHITLRYLLGMV